MVLLACLTVRQQGFWASDLALWRNAAYWAPELGRPALNLATAYRKAGQRDAALLWFIRAAELSEADPRGAEYRQSIAVQLAWMEATWGDGVCERPDLRPLCWP